MQATIKLEDGREFTAEIQEQSTQHPELILNIKETDRDINIYSKVRPR
mgnify:FL=1